MSSTAEFFRGGLVRWWRGDESSSEALFRGLLSISYAYGFAMLLIWLRAPFNELREWKTFVAGWLLVPLLALGAVVIAISRDAGDQRTRLGGLALSQSLVVAISAVLLRVAADAKPSVTVSTLRAIGCIAPSLVAVLGLISPVSYLTILSRPGPATSLALILIAAILLALAKPPSLLWIVLIAGGSGLLVLLREAYSRFLPDRFATHRLDPRWLRLVDLGARAVEVSEGPFLARDVFDPRGNSQRTTGSRAEAGAR